VLFTGDNNNPACPPGNLVKLPGGKINSYRREEDLLPSGSDGYDFYHLLYQGQFGGTGMRFRESGINVNFPERKVLNPVVLMREPSAIRTGLLHPVLLFFSVVM